MSQNSAVRIEKLARIKEKILDLDRNIGRAEARVQTGLETLQKKFNCETLEQAQRKVKRLQQQQKENLEALEKRKQDFVKKYGELLDL